jgi:hypothetical protein
MLTGDVPWHTTRRQLRTRRFRSAVVSWQIALSGSRHPKFSSEGRNGSLTSGAQKAIAAAGASAWWAFAAVCVTVCVCLTRRARSSRPPPAKRKCTNDSQSQLLAPCAPSGGALLLLPCCGSGQGRLYNFKDPWAK